ncbi:D-alanyl-D-alanine carboxypeptidase, partial [Candidatus Roizmanbacteria bacterium]|nr:D-alanyl-D-alanine carboxypeptidase [Candidatus Roizmanbacteria bacterium]
QGIGGLKTGYTENAGENLVSFYKTAAGHELIIVVVKSTDRFEDTKKIVEWIDKNVDYVNLQ